MKIRGSFVTNSSSSNFIIFGSSKESIIKRVRNHDMFGDINFNILDQLENMTPIRGDALKKLYDDEILYTLQYARKRTLEGLASDHPYDWMYTNPSSLISKEAALISSAFLDENVAFLITLDDMYGAERLGWNATGFHYETNAKDGMVLVIGINGH